jgi:hypothetical protein
MEPNDVSPDDLEAVPQFYINGHVYYQRLYDGLLVVLQDDQPVAACRLSHEFVKTMAHSLLESCQEFEEQMDTVILTGPMMTRLMKGEDEG